jgi:hypothetical protein
VGSLSEEDRLTRLRQHLELWEGMLTGASRLGGISDEDREEALINSMIPLARPEIVAAVEEDRVACVFCGLWYVKYCDTGEETYLIDPDRGDDAAIRQGIRAAGHTFAENHDKPVDEHIKSCIAAELARLRDSRIQETQSKSPEDLLPAVLGWPLPNAAVLLEHLTLEQLNDLLPLLFARTEPKTRIITDPPKDELGLRIWYTGVLLANHPAMNSSAQMVIIPVGEEWEPPPPKGVNPTEPMYAKFYEQLAKKLKVRDPNSKSRIRRLMGRDRRTIARYLGSDVQIEVIPDENGRVTVRFRTKDLRLSMETARGKKRGRKTQG